MYKSYASSLTAYKRRKTIEVNIGGLKMGGDNPIRVQSMTTVDTMDTEGSIDEIIRMVDSGCELVRLTAPGRKEAENLKNIREGLKARGVNVPLVADIHFTPNAAQIAAKIVEKVRINPGNFVDKKKFEVIEYTDESYAEELQKIREKFIPLIDICKEHGTALRIGTNHGSLSDRIVNRYGDTPGGMVESALEFLRICDEQDFHQVVVSMKSSNTQVMIQAYRLLAMQLDEEGLKPYPLHLGVTEAGEGEDGRIKSALGIGTLLEDGLGDTVRVSLTEAPEYEAPVAKMLIDRYEDRCDHAQILACEGLPKDPYNYARRKSGSVLNIGGENVPRVITDFSQLELSKENLKFVGHTYNKLLDEWSMSDLGTDYVYLGNKMPDFMLPNGLKAIVNYDVYKEDPHSFPLVTVSQYKPSSRIQFLQLTIKDLSDDLLDSLKTDSHVVLMLSSNNKHALAEIRRAFQLIDEKEISVPIIPTSDYTSLDEERLQLFSATDLGGLLVDGYGDGVMLSNGDFSPEKLNSIAFGVLQASRTRITKTEYISCPSCGRTLFDLQETTALIRAKTEHLKGVKIGIMGCIVNGPGEMADADFGYVGVGKGKITLYKGQEVVKRGIPAENAIDELIELIKVNNRWIEPSEVVE